MKVFRETALEGLIHGLVQGPDGCVIKHDHQVLSFPRYRRKGDYVFSVSVTPGLLVGGYVKKTPTARGPLFLPADPIHLNAEDNKIIAEEAYRH